MKITNSGWSTKVAAWAAAVVITGVVAVSRLYLGAHWLTDVLGGLALGAAWLFALLTGVRTVGRLRTHPPDQPAPPASGDPSPPPTPSTETRPPPPTRGLHG